MRYCLDVPPRKTLLKPDLAVFPMIISSAETESANSEILEAGLPCNILDSTNKLEPVKYLSINILWWLENSFSSLFISDILISPSSATSLDILTTLIIRWYKKYQ